MPPSVVIIGSFMQDLAFRVDQFPRPGETRTGAFAPGPGGKGSNQAIAAGRAGADAVFMGAIGADSFGDGARAFYRKEGVRAHWAIKKSPTGTAGITIDSSGQNQIVIGLGANAELGFSDLDTKTIATAKVVVAQFESNLATTAKALAFARRHGVTTILNPAPMRTDYPKGLLKSVDILIPNETEFMTLLAVQGLPAPQGHQTPAEMAPEELDRVCREFGVPTVVVTLGKSGLFISDPSGWTKLEGCRVKAVDTTGAGDAFVGSFAAALVRFQGDVVQAACFGNAAAALSVTKPGTAQSMPKLRAVTAFLQQQPIRRRSGARSS